MESVQDILNRLSFEELLWITFIGISILNIYGTELEKDYTKNKNYESQKRSSIVFELTIVLTFFIYIYFFRRNYRALKNASPSMKKLYEIKLLGSSLLIAGVLCLLYFQDKQRNFIGSPGV